MILTKNNKTKNKGKKLFNSFLLFYFILTLIVGSLGIAIVASSITVKEAQKTMLDKMSRHGRSNWIYLPLIFFDGLKSYFYKIEKLDLEVNFEDMIILEKIRQEALINNTLPPRDLLPEVNVDLFYKNKKFLGDARLKGDRPIHWKDSSKTSYKIDLNKNNYLFGMNKFSLQKPIARNYVHEWIFHEMSKEFNIIKLKYEFIELSVNGDNRGLYVIEEGFGKELIERNKRRNGPIFGLNEDLNDTNINPIFEIYNKNYWSQSENKNLALTASKKLDDYFKGILNPTEVFDYERWASYFAIVDLTGTSHGALLKSVKFYYNPINGLFEPIPFDGHRMKPNYSKYNLSYDNKLVIDHLLEPSYNERELGLGWLNNLFFIDGKLNDEFYEIYIDKLNFISSENFLKNFFSKNLTKIKKINSHIYADSFWYHDQAGGMGLYYFSLRDFKYQVKNIKNKINKDRKFQILQSNKKNYLFKDFSYQYDLLSLDKFICYELDKKIEFFVNKSLQNFENNYLILDERFNKNLDCRYAQISGKYSKKKDLFRIDYINSSQVFKRFKSEKTLNFEKYFSLDGKSLFLKQDKTIIEHNLYIPKGFVVKIKPKQEILLLNNAFIISNSAWEIGGNGGLTLISGKEDNYGGGLLITDTDDISIIKNTKFSYLKGIDPYYFFEFNILGSINFHQTNVKVFNSSFENIFSEDAINIFRSSFEINKTNYANIFSDAIDIDFSDGKIFFSNFKNINNDAIDFSGSQVQLSDNFFQNISDKIISVGEESDIKILNIIAKFFVGIASKDGSKVVSDGVSFDGISIPFAAYQKKKEYEFGILNIKNFNIENYYVKWIKDEGSQIIADDQPLLVNTKNILPIIYEKKINLIKKQND